MTLKPKPPAELTLDPRRVRALLETQDPDLAGLPVIEVSSGWDIDDHTWARARGWALALGLTYLANAEDDPALEALGGATIAAVLAELDEGGSRI